MTSEIALMNQRAIAMAADSAVTLIDGGKVIIRNDQKKLFNLFDGVPVGTMFFGVADIMGHPWDVLVEHYRSVAKPARLPHVRHYAEDFFAHLDGLEEFFPRARQRDEYKRLVASVYRFIFRLAHYFRETGMKGSDETVLQHAIELVWTRYQSDADGNKRGDLACFPSGFAERIGDEYGGVADDLIGYAFSHFVLDGKARHQLKDIAVFCVVKDMFLEDITGLVFGGYGGDDPYPALAAYNVSAVVGGIVKRAPAGQSRISSDIHSSVALFADSEASYAFLRGIDGDVEAQVYDTFQASAHALVEEVVGRFGDVDPAFRESVRREFQSERVPQMLAGCYETVNAYQRDAYIDPFLSVLEIATRQEMGTTAEDLVGLNIFRKKITGQDQTVGGAVDVAVISRDTGFTWWKRQGV